MQDGSNSKMRSFQYARNGICQRTPRGWPAPKCSGMDIQDGQ